MNDFHARFVPRETLCETRALAARAMAALKRLMLSGAISESAPAFGSDALSLARPIECKYLF